MIRMWGVAPVARLLPLQTGEELHVHDVPHRGPCCVRSIEAGATTSIRDIYYDAKHLIAGRRRTPSTSRPRATRSSRTRGHHRRPPRGAFAPPRENKGAMVGPMTVRDTGDDASTCGAWAPAAGACPDRRRQPHPVPRARGRVRALRRKGAVWSRLNEDRFWQRHVRADPRRGMARRLLRRMHESSSSPVYVLTDNDPGASTSTR